VLFELALVLASKMWCPCGSIGLTPFG